MIYKTANQTYVALLGNPNCGKTAVFNHLTGLNQKVSNYPGITVEKKIGKLKSNVDEEIYVLDLPGTYSITPESIDERIVAEQFMDWIHGINRPSAIISVVDATNLSRNLYLTTQLLDLGIPVILALNMMDRVLDKSVIPKFSDLKEKFGLAAVVPMSALEGWGIDELKNAIHTAIVNRPPRKSKMLFSSHLEIHELLNPLVEYLQQQFDYTQRLARVQALRLITRQSAVDLYRPPHSGEHSFDTEIVIKIEQLRAEAVLAIEKAGLNHRTLEATIRYSWLDRLLQQSHIKEIDSLIKESRSEKLDKVLTHRIFGPIVFIALMVFIFQSIFTWSTYPMDWIDTGVGTFGNYILNIMPVGILRDLIVEGIIGGVGAILIFLPQILILVFFITVLEDSGYMSRVAFMLDKFMTKVGLHGRSVLPLMSGYACAIPGVMSTRTIDSWKERLTTIMVLPLMSCSARLPVYALMIGAFIPAKKVFGLLNLQGFTLIFMYFLGTATALVVAKIFSKFIKVKGQSSFVMELPPYRIPLMRSVFQQVYLRGRLFLLNAGKIIMAVSIVLWFLASFPKVTADLEKYNNDTGIEQINAIDNSYAGKIGHAIEPIIRPLGFDWKIGVGLLTSFAAREVIISTLATLYNVEDNGENVISLSESMKNDINPKTGLPVFSTLVALSLMVFFVYAAQCMATFAIVRHETNSWKWPLIMVVYMTSIAYMASFIVYQGGTLIGKF
ncbi:MAG: ferrous iron transport protein B [Planctomycetia bacterium]|nr:ferrous iron transport protein B [Planctomycetia bacterium]